MAGTLYGTGAGNHRYQRVNTVLSQQFVLTVAGERNDRVIHSSFLQTHHLLHLHHNDKTVHLECC